MNLASLWKLPVVFLCQNNQLAEHTPIAEYAPATDLAARAASYAMHAEAVDGFDPIATWRVLGAAVDACRQGHGPRFVECKSYRLAGHVGASDYSYMPADLLEAARERDPAPTFRRWLLETAAVDEGRLSEIDSTAQATVDDAFTKAYASPPPPAAELRTDLFADGAVA
jgi:pyruvate dehydrogenase E1 component alpha subunit